MRGNNDWLDVLETRQYLAHSFKGTTWGKHKYVDIKNGKYIYPEDLKAQRRASNRRSESGSVLRQRAAANYSSSQGRSMPRRAEQARAQAERRAREQSAARSSAPEQPKSKNLFDGMGNRIAGLGSSALNAGANAAKAAGQGLNKLGTAVGGAAKDAVKVAAGAAGEGAKNLFDAAQNGLDGAANAARGAVGAAGNALNAAGRGISGAYDTARDAAGNAVDAVGNVARGAYNAVTGADNRATYDRANERLASIDEGQGAAYERSYYAKRDLENARQSGDQERIRQAEAAYRQAENNRIMMDQEHGDAVDAARTAAQNYANNPGLFYDRNYVDAPYHDLIRARTFGDRVNEAKDAAATAVNSTINGVADAAGNLFDQAGKRIGGMLGIESKEDRNRREMARNSAIAEGDRRDFNDRQMAVMEATNRYDKALADREAARRNLGMTRADIDSSLRDYNDAEYNIAQKRFEGIRNGQSLASAQSDLNTISQQMNSAQQALRYAMGTGDQSRISFAQNALRELQSRYDDALDRAQSAQGAYDRSVQAYAQARNDYDTRYPSVPTGSTRDPRQVMSEAQAAYDAADRKFRDAENAYMPIYNDYLDKYPNQNSDPFYLLPGYANGDEIRDWYRNKGRR